MISNILIWLDMALLTLGLWGVFAIILFAFLHPSLEFPAAIFLFVMMMGLTEDLFLSLSLLILSHTLGSALTYYLCLYLPSFQSFSPKMMRLIENSVHWYNKKSEWQHILVMSLPLVYTYPLRLYWTRKQSSFYFYMIKMLIMYSLLYLWNVIIYIFIQDIYNESPSLILTIFFVGFAMIIYQIRKSF
jgi:membrane protein YqaA with SNARE-associated domain